MTYAIQQFHATHYQTIAEARTLDAAIIAAGEIKRKCPDLPVKITTINQTPERKTATEPTVG